MKMVPKALTQDLTLGKVVYLSLSALDGKARQQTL